MKPSAVLTSVVLLGAILARPAQAQLACPLTNSNLTSLRTAAQGLAKNITLTGACAAYQNNLNASNAELQTLATTIQTVGSTEGVAAATTLDTSNLQTLAGQTVTQLNNINTLFKDQKCGEQLAGHLDYAESFMDVAINATPFLALYGGAAAAPWVLGTALGGAATKIMIGFFKNKVVDMRKVDQSSAFIKNSCSFYFLNQIKTSMDDLQIRQMPRIQVELEETRATLNRHKTQSPGEPNTALFKDHKNALADKTKLAAATTKLAVDPMEACAFVARYARGEDKRGETAGLVERTWDMYEKSLKEKEDFDWEKTYFMDALNRPLSAEVLDADVCNKHTNRWLTKMRSLNEKALAWASPLLAEVPAMKAYQAWSTKKDALEADIKTLEARIKFFNVITGTGFNIEYSEIISSHQQVQDGLFDTYRYLALFRMRGLAEAWLQVKHEDGKASAAEFEKRRKEVNGRIAKIQTALGSRPLNRENVTAFAQEYRQKNGRDHADVHRSVVTDVCNQLRKTWSSWYDGLIHAQAGRDYCLAFDNVIDRMDYPAVQTLCFGNTDRRGRPLNSLKNLVSSIKDQQAIADQVRTQMIEYACESAPTLSEELLQVSLN